MQKIEVENLLTRVCKKCGYPILMTKQVGCNITARCIQCDASNGNVSREDAGKRERTHKSVHSAIPERVRNAVRMRAGCKCEICGRLAADSVLHVSHLISVDDGLRFEIPTSVLNSEENLAMFCEQCNTDMHTETVPLRIAVIILAVRSRKTMRNFQDVINSTNQ